MSGELDIYDLERDFLADVLELLGGRLSELESLDTDPPEESYVFDPMEHLAGVGIVAAQRYLASVCKWLSVPKEKALLLGPQRKGIAVAAVVNAAANYWKHIEDETPIRASTRKTLEEVGVVLDSSYCVSNALYECGYQNFKGLLDDLVNWRNAVMEHARPKT